MNKFQTALLPVTILGIIIISPTLALAHTKANSGTFSAVLYNEPHGKVVIGQPAVVQVDFSQSQTPFDAQAAQMTISIQSSSTPKVSAPLPATGTSTAAYPYTYAKDEPYAIVVSGVTATKQPFTFNYYISPVEHGAMDDDDDGDHMAGMHAMKPLPGPLAFLGVHGGHVLITLLLIAILLFVVITERRKEKKAIRAAEIQENNKKNS